MRPGDIWTVAGGKDYAASRARRGVLISMSRAGNPYDNGKAERFMQTLKGEEVNGKPYASIDEARTDIGAFLETVYNRARLHSALGYKPGRVRGRTPPPRNRLKGHTQALVTQIKCLSRGVQFIFQLLYSPRLPRRRASAADRNQRHDQSRRANKAFIV